MRGQSHLREESHSSIASPANMSSQINHPDQVVETTPSAAIGLAQSRSQTKSSDAASVSVESAHADDTVVYEGDITPVGLGAPSDPDKSFVEDLDPQAGQYRSTTRFRCDTNVAIVPVALDGRPGAVQWSEAETVDVSLEGISFSLKTERRLDTKTVVLGVDTSAGKRFGTAMLSHQDPQPGGFRVGGKWITGVAGDPLIGSNLRPRIDSRTMRFAYPCHEECLEQWHSLGVLKKYLIDRVLVCRQCETLPTWRRGCHQCGSGRIDQDRLVHHFACAHVAAASEFETPTGLHCPKCRTKNMIVGSDFEFIDGPLQCFDCDASGGLPTMSGLCHRCFDRFEHADAFEKKLYGYNVDRLDPLRDLVNESSR